MSWQTKRLSEVVPSPWRNGGGVTRELLAWPDAQHWVWRMSVAEVERDGPFSQFDGVQRWFAVLQGAGVELQMQTPAGVQTHGLTSASAPLCFDGAVPTQCHLREGATQDFNLMLRSKQATGHMQRISGAFQTTTFAPKLVAAYAVSAGVSIVFDGEVMAIPAQTLAWRHLPAGAQVQIDAAQALWMEIDA